jgi:hypothetical protein
MTQSEASAQLRTRGECLPYQTRVVLAVIWVDVIDKVLTIKGQFHVAARNLSVSAIEKVDIPQRVGTPENLWNGIREIYQFGAADFEFTPDPFKLLLRQDFIVNIGKATEPLNLLG